MTGVFLSQSNTRLRLLHLLYDMILPVQNNKTRFFYVLYSDKTWVFDRSERAQGPIYVIINYYFGNSIIFLDKTLLYRH